MGWGKVGELTEIGWLRSKYPKNSLFQRCLRLLKYHPCLVSTLTFLDSIRDEVLLTLTLLGNLELEIFNYPIRKNTKTRNKHHFHGSPQPNSTHSSFRVKILRTAFGVHTSSPPLKGILHSTFQL